MMKKCKYQVNGNKPNEKKENSMFLSCNERISE